MFSRITEKTQVFSDRVELIYLALTINLFVLRIALPFLEYLFIPAATLLFFYVIYLLWNESKRHSIIIEYSRIFYLFILVGLSFLIALIYTSNYSFLVLREALTVLFFIFLTLVFFLFIRSAEQFKKFQKESLRQVLIIAVIASILGVTKFILHLYGINLLYLYKNGLSPVGTSLKMDHNFFSLVSFFGIILILWKLKEPLQKKQWILYQLLLFLFTVNICFSFSRRGIFLLAILLANLMFFCILRNVSKQFPFKLKGKVSIPFLYMLLIILFFTSGILFVCKLDPNIRLKIIRKVGLKTWVVKKNLYSLVYEYSTILNRNVELNQIYSQIWPYRFDPKDPDSGWATHNYSSIYPLEGPGSELIPDGTIGYKLDKTCEGVCWHGNTYCITPIEDSFVHQEEAILASIYCYVSDEYSGGPVTIDATGKVFGKIIDHYNLDFKNTWQKLELTARATGDSTKTSIRLKFVLEGVSSFDSLKGSVIFAYPEIKIVKIDPRYPDSGWGYLEHTTVFPLEGNGVNILPPDTKGYKLDSTVNGYYDEMKAISVTSIARPYIRVGETVKVQVFCYVSKDYDGSYVSLGSDRNSFGDTRHFYDLNKKGTWQLLDINFTGIGKEVDVFLVFVRFNSKNFRELNGYIIFANPKIKLTQSSCIIPREIPTYGNQLVQSYSGQLSCISLLVYEFKLLKKLIPTLTSSVFYESSDTLLAPMSIDGLMSNRITRWRFALIYYFNDYNVTEKLFGGGFDYIPAYGQEFFDDPNHMDYPHNTIISAFLYSGIVGGIIYIVFLLQSFYYYFKYRKYHMMFLIFYLLTFYYVFFSSNSHFELPLFTFLSIIPFFTRYIVKKEQITDSSINS